MSLSENDTGTGAPRQAREKGEPAGPFVSASLNELIAGIDEMLRHGAYGKRPPPKPGAKVLRPFDTLDDK